MNLVSPSQLLAASVRDGGRSHRSATRTVASEAEKMAKPLPRPRPTGLGDAEAVGSKRRKQENRHVSLTPRLIDSAYT